MAKKIKVWLNNELSKCLHCTDVITFYHIFVTELVFTFFVFKYQNHWISKDGKRSPCSKILERERGMGVIKDPLERKVLGGGGGANQRVFWGGWIFSGTTQCAPLLLCGSCAHWLVQRVDASTSKLLHVPTHGQIWWHPHRDTVRDQTSWTFTSNV